MESRLIITGFVMLLVGAASGYWYAQQDVEPAAHEMSDTMAGMTSGLEGKSGDEFDHAFIDEMIVHHEGAVAMAEQALKVSQRPEIRTLAEAIITAQTTEIGMMRGWLRAWFAE
jgi:uncharacterized protein (DUF305 family)